MSTAPPARPAPDRTRATGGARLGGWLARPLTSFHVVLGVFGLLTLIGLVMVLSASGVEAASEGESPFSPFQKQLSFVLLGAVLFYAALRTPLRVVRALAPLALGGSVLALVLVLVPGIGVEINGTRGWFQLGGLSFQPAEAAKIAIAVWGASVLATHRPHLAPVRHLLVPLLPVTALVATLILVQPDLGSTVTLAVILLALLWFGGLPIRLVALGGTVAVAGAVAFGLTVGPRSDRIASWLDPTVDPQGIGYQALQARYSLADGGWFGVGLGQSRAKWNYLPNANNDFIFAIIGEELGFLGGVVVLVLFGVLAWVGLRIATRSVDPFLVLLSATTTVWLVGQAFLNIGYVTGLLPVTGLQLPMISSGGTSTALTMVMFGLLASAARHEPHAVSALRHGDEGRFSRLLHLPAPQPYVARRPRPAARPSAPRTARPSAPRTARTSEVPRPRETGRPRPSGGRGSRPARGGRA